VTIFLQLFERSRLRSDLRHAVLEIVQNRSYFRFELAVQKFKQFSIRIIGTGIMLYSGKPYFILSHTPAAPPNAFIKQRCAAVITENIVGRVDLLRGSATSHLRISYARHKNEIVLAFHYRRNGLLHRTHLPAHEHNTVLFSYEENHEHAEDF